MKIAFESELMQNQKHAEVMAPDLKFEVLQTSSGSSLFFSIGTDGVFYLTQETTGSKTGWGKMDLSSALSSQHNNAKVAAKAFDVSQNAQNGNIDLALAITVGNNDCLYLARGHSNSDTAWAAGVTWTYIPYDDPAHPMPTLSIADLYILQTPIGENFVVDILAQPGSPLNTVFRYYLTPATKPGAQQWYPHDLSTSLAAGSISSCLGNRPNDYVAGMYTYATITGIQELSYTPLYNAFNRNNAPSTARFTLPAGATAIAAALDASGNSNLFVAPTVVCTCLRLPINTTAQSVSRLLQTA
jgi:hypothetical protein